MKWPHFVPQCSIFLHNISKWISYMRTLILPYSIQLVNVGILLMNSLQLNLIASFCLMMTKVLYSLIYYHEHLTIPFIYLFENVPLDKKPRRMNIIINMQYYKSLNYFSLWTPSSWWIILHCTYIIVKSRERNY